MIMIVSAPELLWMEVPQRLGVVIDPLHVTEVRQQPPVPNHSTVLTLTVREYHLQLRQTTFRLHLYYEVSKREFTET